MFIYFVLRSKTNKDNFTVIFHPLLLKPHYVQFVYAVLYEIVHVQCREPEKGPQNVQSLKKTTGLDPSRLGAITLWE